jgi:hypothetical protein
MNCVAGSTPYRMSRWTEPTRIFSRCANYLIVGGSLISIRVENSDETAFTRYFHTDHLGSIAAIANEAGAVMERLSYDAGGMVGGHGEQHQCRPLAFQVQ